MTRTHDLTEGSLAQHFRRLAVPAAIGMVFTTLYNVVDVFFAGLLGTPEQAGLAISFQAFFIFITFGFGLSSAMTALVGNAIGAKQEDEARILAARGMGFGVIITPKPMPRAAKMRASFSCFAPIALPTSAVIADDRPNPHVMKMKKA